jgi:hypothetical protein
VVAIAVLAVKAEPLRGRFARLDGSARRWRFAGQILLVNDRGFHAAIVHQKDLEATGRAGETLSSRRDRSAAVERRSLRTNAPHSP